MADSDNQRSLTSRIPAIDAARGAALIAMAIYHFAWDLQFFGYVAPDLATTGGWKIFARCIASSFLFLVGVGLVLAHGRGIRWAGYWRRLAQILAAAAAITVATLIATPDSYVFFGILHHIALASVLGLAFLRLPAAVTLAAAAGVLWASSSLASEVLDVPWLWWTGLSPAHPKSNDFVPLFPWFAAVLAGIGAWKLAQSAGLPARLARLPMSSAPARGLRFIGRHSLAFYLLHQPVLIGLVAAAAWVAPPDKTAMRQRAFVAQCESECRQSDDAAFCAAYCGCFLDGLRDSGRFDELYENADAPGREELLTQLVNTCAAEATHTGGMGQ